MKVKQIGHPRTATAPPGGLTAAPRRLASSGEFRRTRRRASAENLLRCLRGILRFGSTELSFSELDDADGPSDMIKACA